MDSVGFRSIFNNDINNILVASSGGNMTPAEYQRAVNAILDGQPGLLAQNVGLPEAVIYPSSVATTFDKYIEEVTPIAHPVHRDSPYGARQSQALKKLFGLGTDPLSLTIDACRKRGIPIVASFRMNAEDYYHAQILMSDFERRHPEWKIADANCLDPAVPQVYEHRMKIFSEVAQRFDVDGLEFDFRRWHHMVSDPLRNHVVLTRMVHDAREMLDKTAREKGCKKLILGARVGPSLATDPSPFVYPGCFNTEKPQNASCKDLGLDVRTWIQEGWVDYVCPTLFNSFLPGLPKTVEFVELATGTAVGVYPTLWPLAAWQTQIVNARRKKRLRLSFDPRHEKALALYKHDLCTAALRIYEDGADGISTFNWNAHLRNAHMPYVWTEAAGTEAGTSAIQTHIYPLLKDPAAILRYREEPWALPPEG